MKGEARHLHWFSNEQIHVEVPFFQRPYVWDEDDWENLLDSIDNAKQQKMPFIGSFILQETSTKNSYLVIDGQQRITTVSVMIKAFLDCFGEKIITENNDLAVEIKGFIYSQERIGLRSVYSPRLLPSSVDSKDFNTVMAQQINKEDFNKCNGKIKQAYEYFHNIFSKRSDQQNIEFAIKVATNYFFFMSIILDSQEDDEQKIFDSVNSLGKGLTKADLIKNFLFSKIKEKGVIENITMNEILDLHENKWQKIFYSEDTKEFWEKNFTLGRIKTNNIETFFKNFAVIDGIYSPSKTGSLDGLYQSYKEQISKLDSFGKLKDYLVKIADYATSYYKYNKEYSELSDVKMSDTLMSTLLILNETNTSTFDPYILYLYKNRPSNFDEQLKTLRKFLVKRILWKGTTKNYNNMCVKLINENDPINYLKTYKEDNPLPIDTFPAGLFNLSNVKGRFILFITEMIKRDSVGDIFETGLKYDNFTLEHVMPKEWETYWSNVPCFKADEVDFKTHRFNFSQVTEEDEIKEARNYAIYSIGNMTLLTGPLNTKIQNRDIVTKMEGGNGNHGVKRLTGSVQITKDVTDIYDRQHSWDERDIYKRTYKIFDDLNNYFKFRE